MKTGAVISAAGHKTGSSVFQPLLPVGKTTVIRRIIITLKQAGVEPIIVITGREGDLLEKHIARMGVICLRNEAYETTDMFYSVGMGLRYIEELCSQVLILPVKYPLFLADTVERLLKSGGKAACPVYQGRRGHPVLISSDLIPQIIEYTGPGGLRGALRQDSVSPLVEEIPVAAPGVIMLLYGKGDWAGPEGQRVAPHRGCQPLF